MKAHVEQIPPSPRHSFICRRFAEPQFDHPLHFHPEIEFTYIVRSRGTLMVGDHVGEFNPGDFYLLGANLPHIFRNTAVPDQGAVSEVLHLPGPTMARLFDQGREFTRWAGLMARAQLGLKFEHEAVAAAGRLLQRIRQADGLRRWTLFFELAEELLQHAPAESLASPGFAGTVNLEASDRLQRACQYILEHFDEDLAHEDLAAMVHLSPAYFSRLFRRTTRRTCTAFLTEVRLGHACRLLLDTDRSIVEIAFSSGFRNLSSFNRRFREAYHCSPREYRRQSRPERE